MKLSVVLDFLGGESQLAGSMFSTLSSSNTEGARRFRHDDGVCLEGKKSIDDCFNGDVNSGRVPASSFNCVVSTGC